ncbi:MAG: hypothetical protein Q4P78_02840 [Rothia sp. (in: high G+C Gram-positive bacteria)]|uniref:hypothetical protein n=1 Tax=Rothia sp. (in: high G+C Gram-positive bacteria) TaxID=1885016 RepID=UPI0026E00219|nr:hypothetical protein [Rothia sp. (in: high G+C Gram-positive bacteria)]MDO5750126.1 hypothetical protein [Rothia sp. (in: high G+C Gram-positive bacteria)]
MTITPEEDLPAIPLSVSISAASTALIGLALILHGVLAPFFTVASGNQNLVANGIINVVIGSLVVLTGYRFYKGKSRARLYSIFIALIAGVNFGAQLYSLYFANILFQLPLLTHVQVWIGMIAAVVSLGGIFWPTTGDYIDAMTEIEESEKARRRESGMR